MDRVLTMREISERMGVSMQSLHTWRRGSPLRDPLPAVSEIRGAGVAVTIRESDLIEYLERYRPDLLDRWVKI